MLRHAKGNLIDMAENGDFDIIVHGCNCQNVMGSGIAKEIRERYPQVYSADSVAHRDALDEEGWTPGSPICLLGNYSETTDTENARDFNFRIINAYTQVNFVPRGVDHFEYGSFSLILRKLAAVYPSKRFGFPYIGMGLAGGDKKRILTLLEDFANTIEQTGGSATLVEYEG